MCVCVGMNVHNIMGLAMKRVICVTQFTLNAPIGNPKKVNEQFSRHHYHYHTIQPPLLTLKFLIHRAAAGDW